MTMTMTTTLPPDDRMTAMPCRFRLPLCAALLAVAGAAAAHDYPTADRVVYVQECMRTHPGPHYEMLNKCSCALDRTATEVSYDDYITAMTTVNAATIGGERGAEFRDNASVQPTIKRWRELQARVQQACFIADPVK